MLTEYRALRASVLRLWAVSKGEETHADELEQLMRFNEAIDQAITESVARYTAQVQRYTHLFMGMLGHDIRNPLGTIIMSAEVLVRSGQLQRKAVDPIVNGAKRIQGIVELIVDFSRAQTNGVMPISPNASDLRPLFDSVLAETRVRHPEAELMLRAEGDLANRERPMDWAWVSTSAARSSARTTGRCRSLDRRGRDHVRGPPAAASRPIVRNVACEGSSMAAIQPHPKQNHLLAALSPEVQGRLFPHLELAELPLRALMYGAKRRACLSPAEAPRERGVRPAR